jgi:hypothetical protein
MSSSSAVREFYQTDPSEIGRSDQVGFANTTPESTYWHFREGFKKPSMRALGLSDDSPADDLGAISFRAPREIYAATSRRAGRINASKISEEEREQLLMERQSLLDKKFEGVITRQEENRLQYVRWSLDRIEDARYGFSIDKLEDVVARYENFLKEIRALHDDLERHAGRKKR